MASVTSQITLKKGSLLRRAGGEFSLIVIGEVTAVLGNLAGVRILTGLLSPRDYGELALAMTAAMLTNQLIFAPIGNAAGRFFAPAREARKLHSYGVALGSLVAGGAVLAGVLAVVVSVVLGSLGYAHWRWFVISAFSFAIFCGANDIANGVQCAARQRAVVALHAGAAPWCRFLIAAALLETIGRDGVVAMAGYAIAMGLVACSQWAFGRGLREAAIPDVDHPMVWRGRLLQFAWPFMTWGVFTWAQQASDRWALGMLASAKAVGLYAVVFQLGYYPMSFITNLLVQFVAPILYERAGDASDPKRLNDARHTNRKLVVVSVVVTAAAFLLLIPLHPLIFRLFTAPAYTSVSYLFPWLVLSGGLFAAGQLASLDFLNSLNTHRLILPKIATALIAVLLNFAGAYRYGLSGVVAANVIFSFLYLFAMLWMTHMTEGQLAAE